MGNNKSAIKQETVRRILVIIIIVLLLAIIYISIRMIASKSCTNPGQSGMLPTDTPPAVTPTPAPITEVPTNPAEPSDAAETPFAVSPTPQQSQPTIAKLVTEGSMGDVLARLEQLKTLPSSETLILLDVGHGGFDPGTSGIDTGVTEADINLQIARRVAEKLAAKGYYVFMTRMGDYACAESKDKDMELRTRIMRLDIFDCSVSIHQNALATDRRAHGVRLYHYQPGTAGAKYAEDEKLAARILESICAMTDENRTRTDTGNFMVCREPHAPAALVECGFLTNPEDERKLSDPSYQDVFAQAVANGIENYLNGAS